MKNQPKAYILALTAVLFWSTIGTAFKISLKYLDPLNLLFYSSLTASVLLFLILSVTGKLNQMKGLTFRELAASASLGLLNPFLYYTVLLKAYDRLPAQEAGTLNYIWPLVLVLLSIPLLRQKISPVSILAILISFSGIVVISTHGNITGLTFSDPTGVLLAVGSALFWALYWIFSLKDPRDAVIKLFLAFCLGCLCTLITLLLSGGISLPDIRGIGGAVYIGIFEMGLTFLIWLNALKFSSTTARVSNLIYLSPFISLILIHLVIGEVILFSTFVGLLLIVSGIILQQYLKR
jgi:drug/metabolite transporter (DMT)-like permease